LVMSSAVPDGWNTVSLAEGIDILSGYPFDSSSFTDDSSKTGLIRIRDLVRQKVATYFDGAFDDNYLIRKGDVLIGMDGDFNIVKWNSAPSLLNQRICKVTVAGKIFDLAYLYQDLQKDLLEINNQTGSTTVKHLSVKDIRGIHKSYPPLPEQKKIASILTSVDEVIENTQKQIDKLQDLKKATMNELLTKGIGHTEFKDSELGRIPKSWEARQVQEIAKIIRGASPRPKGDPRYYGGTVPRLMGSDVTRDGKYVFPKTDFLTPEGAKLSRPMSKGGLTIVCSGTVGVPSILGVDACIHDGFLGLVDISNQCTTEFLYYAFLPLQGKFDSSATHGGVFTNLTTEILKEFIIGIPPLGEQREIVRHISSLDEHLNAQINKLSQTQSLKKSLMQDLLTGKVRVTVN
jgi:type I restriction enzyme S subunit